MRVLAQKETVPNKGYKVIFRDNRNGTYDVGIMVRGIRIKASHDRQLFKCVDLEARLSNHVEYLGHKMHPKLILKIYARPLNEFQRDAIIESQAVELLRKNSPIAT